MCSDDDRDRPYVLSYEDWKLLYKDDPTTEGAKRIWLDGDGNVIVGLTVLDPAVRPTGESRRRTVSSDNGLYDGM